MSHPAWARAVSYTHLGHARLLEEAGFHDIVLSLKASSVPLTVEAYRLAAKETDYPLHVGVTEAGLPGAGNIKSAIGIGALLPVSYTHLIGLTRALAKEVGPSGVTVNCCLLYTSRERQGKKAVLLHLDASSFERRPAVCRGLQRNRRMERLKGSTCEKRFC